MSTPRMSELLDSRRLLLLRFFVFSGTLFLFASGRIHTLRLQGESRKLIRLSSFGFDQDGYMVVRLSDLVLPKKANLTYGLTLDKSLRGASELLNSWDDKLGSCPLTKVNATEAAVIFFLVEFIGSNRIQLRVIRNGDLQNLTVTHSDNATEPFRSKRSTRKSPLSLSPRQKRDTGSVTSSNETSDEETIGVTLSPLSDILVSVDLIPGLVKGEEEPFYEFYFTVHISEEKDVGLYSLAFHNCYRSEDINITAEMIENNNGNYLSIGQMPLPVMYFVFSVVYFAVGSLWFYIICVSKEGVFKIHYLMLALMYIKSMSLLFHGVNYHFIRTKGQQEEAFAILFYIVYLMRGIFMFVTIVLIGAGWTFVKHILSDRDKKIFVIVIPLQILTNVASIILSESEEGQSSYSMWKDLFILVDLLCCGAILFPVVWSIRHLQQASQTDGKAAVNLEKLKIFRHFYILVVCYIYFTRIIILLLSIAVPFRFEWLDECFVQIATLAFFMLTGYKFRPASNNPYLQAQTSDDESEMEVLTQSGALEGVTRVNIKGKNREESSEPLLKQRENSHEYD